MSVYRVSIHQRTTKGKYQELRSVFVSTDAPRDIVEKAYRNKYSPLSIDLEKIEEVTKLSLEQEFIETPILKILDGDMYSDPTIRLYRKYLPQKTNDLLNIITATEKVLADTKKEAAKALDSFVGSPSISFLDKECVTVRGYLKPIKLMEAEHPKE